MGRVEDPLQRIDGPEDVGDVGHAHRAGALVEELLVLLEDQFAVVVHRDHPQAGAGLPADELPGDDVGVVLHLRDEDLVPLAQPGAAPALGDQIDGLGRPAHEDDFARAGGVEEALDLTARSFVGLGGAHAQLVHAAVDVGAIPPVEMVHRTQHRLGLLGRRSVVEVDQRMAVDFLAQAGEVRADRIDVEVGDSRFSRPLGGITHLCFHRSGFRCRGGCQGVFRAARRGCGRCGREAARP